MHKVIKTYAKMEVQAHTYYLFVDLFIYFYINLFRFTTYSTGGDWDEKM